MTSKVGNTAVFFAGAVPGYALTQLLEGLGVASGPAGWVGIAAGGGAVYAYDKIVSRCDDTGVYIDINTAAGPIGGIGAVAVLSSIYGA